MNGELTVKDQERAGALIQAGFAAICVFIVVAATLIIIFGLERLDPKWAFSLGIDMVSLIASAILYYSVMHDSHTTDEHNIIFSVLLIVNAIGLMIDMAAWSVEGVPQLATLNRVLNALLFTNNNTLIYVFWMYVTYAIGSDRKIVVSATPRLMVIYVVMEILSLANIFYPLFFSIDSSGTYHRETLYPVSMLFMLAVLPPFFIRVGRSNAARRDKIIASSFFVLPIISQILSAMFFGITAVQAAALISILLIHGVLVADRGKKLEVTKTELDMAAEIQAAMMPNIFPAFPDRSDFDIYATMDPAREVGGDFYDFFLIDKDHLAVVMADVSGKGVPASLFMMSSKIILQSCAMLGLSPAEILQRTNEAICSNNPMEMFVTAWIGILDLDTGVLTAASAGHEYPVLMEPGNKFKLLKDKHGLVIGAYDSAVYKEYELTLAPGSKLFLYTDGVPEATDSDQKMFGMDRMVDALNRDPGADPKQLLANMHRALDEFTGAAEQFDDTTMLCLEYKGRR